MINKPEIIEYQNGLRVILQDLPYTGICSVNIKFASGSCWEDESTSGISHFIEHMLFKGTTHRTAFQIAEKTDEIGGIANAYTAKENTCLYVSALSEHGPEALDILCDMAVNPLMAETDVATEKSVIIDEIEMYDDSPEDVCAEANDEAVWDGSPLSLKILGTRESVNSFTADDLRERHKKFFAPERTVISICGHYNKDEMLKVIDKYYSDSEDTGFDIISTKAEFKSKVTTVERDFRQNQIILSFPGIDNFDKRKYAALLLSNMLGASTSSKLFQRLREELGLVYSVDCYNTAIGKAAIFSICAGLSPGDEKEVIEETKKIIADFCNTITEKDLSRAIEQAVSGFVMGLESSSSRASRNSRQILLYGKIASDEETINAYRSVTLEDIKDVAHSIFDMSKASLCVAGKVKSNKYYYDILGGT